jgi:hypothetical protein
MSAGEIRGHREDFVGRAFAGELLAPVFVNAATRSFACGHPRVGPGRVE